MKVMYERGKVWTLNPVALSKVTGLSAAAAEAQRKGIITGEERSLGLGLTN